MRIAHLSATFPPYYAGSGNACFYQAEALAARGHDVEVFTAAYPGVPVDPAGVRVHRYAARLRLGNAPLIPQLALLDGFDVVHLHQPFIFGAEAALAATARSGAPLVSSYHNELQADGLKGLLFAGYDRTVAAHRVAAVGAADRPLARARARGAAAGGRAGTAAGGVRARAERRRRRHLQARERARAAR